MSRKLITTTSEPSPSSAFERMRDEGLHEFGVVVGPVTIDCPKRWSRPSQRIKVLPVAFNALEGGLSTPERREAELE
jgi:hypothetical protein